MVACGERTTTRRHDRQEHAHEPAVHRTARAPLATLAAVLERSTSANEETGSTVARVATSSSGPDLLTVGGPLLGAQPGASLCLHGGWTSHSQGSAYPCVAVPVTTSAWMLLQRNLLETALTRARRLVLLVGSLRAVAKAVRTDPAGRRYAGLADRLGRQGGARR